MPNKTKQTDKSNVRVHINQYKYMVDNTTKSKDDNIQWSAAWFMIWSYTQYFSQFPAQLKSFWSWRVKNNLYSENGMDLNHDIRLLFTSLALKDLNGVWCNIIQNDDLQSVMQSAEFAYKI